MVGVCRSGCVGRLFSGNRVVSCRSGLVVLEKYEAYIEACSNQAVLNLSGNLEVQVQIAAVRVRVHVGPLMRTRTRHCAQSGPEFGREASSAPACVVSAIRHESYGACCPGVGPPHESDVPGVLVY
jgi:hypothetical protein